MKAKMETISNSNIPASPAGLFDRIILAIRHEQEIRRTRRLLFMFFGLFLVSSLALPISTYILVNQVKTAGTIYFISAMFSNFGIFIIYWKDFLLAIAERLPLFGILVFSASLAVSVFTLRLFLYRKGLLIKYLTHKHNLSYGW